MHTAFQLKETMFSVRLDGQTISREELLRWSALDRLGVVVRSPFGLLGAGLLIMLAITAFYDVASQKRRRRPIYPEIYLLHVGGRWGANPGFDFWPERKELFVEAEPAAVLAAINNVAITHLLVPEGVPGGAHLHRYKEPEAALDRLKQCYAYSSCGAAQGADISISSDSPEPLKNYQASLYPESLMEIVEQGLRTDPTMRRGTLKGDDTERACINLRGRLAEVARDDVAYLQAARRLRDAQQAHRLEERLRRIPVADAIGLLA